MVEPRYQELLKSDIPTVSKDGVHVVVIAGESMGASVSEWANQRVYRNNMSNAMYIWIYNIYMYIYIYIYICIYNCIAHVYVWVCDHKYENDT